MEIVGEDDEIITNHRGSYQFHNLAITFPDNLLYIKFYQLNLSQTHVNTETDLKIATFSLIIDAESFLRLYKKVEMESPIGSCTIVLSESFTCISIFQNNIFRISNYQDEFHVAFSDSFTRSPITFQINENCSLINLSISATEIPYFALYPFGSTSKKFTINFSFADVDTKVIHDLNRITLINQNNISYYFNGLSFNESYPLILSPKAYECPDFECENSFTNKKLKFTTVYRNTNLNSSFFDFEDFTSHSLMLNAIYMPEAINGVDWQSKNFSIVPTVSNQKFEMNKYTKVGLDNIDLQCLDLSTFFYLELKNVSRVTNAISKSLYVKYDILKDSITFNPVYQYIIDCIGTPITNINVVRSCVYLETEFNSYLIEMSDLEDDLTIITNNNFLLITVTKDFSKSQTVVIKFSDELTKAPLKMQFIELIDSHNTSFHIIHDNHLLYIETKKGYIASGISFEGSGKVYINGKNIEISDKYCICEDFSEYNCDDYCIPEYGPIIHSDDVPLINKFLPELTSVTFTLAQQMNDSVPVFYLSNYKNTSLTIFGLPDHQADIILIGNDNRNEWPLDSIYHCFINLEIEIQHSNELFFYNLTLLNSVISTTMNSVSIFTKIIQIDLNLYEYLFSSPNIHLMSPEYGMNITSQNYLQQIELTSTTSFTLTTLGNISLLIDMSKWKYKLPTIFTTSGYSKDDPLKITLPSLRPNDLSDIPDMRIDVSRSDGPIFVYFPGQQWGPGLEDISSKLEIYHGNASLYVFGNYANGTYSTTPPTIFHSGSGEFYFNGIISSFKSKYCVCDYHYQQQKCMESCSSIGPIISFDSEDIFKSVHSNPTRHISYIVVGSTENNYPTFYLSYFLVKSFTISSEKPSMRQTINLNGEDAYIYIVPVYHTFQSLNIQLTLNETSLEFYNLNLVNCIFSKSNPPVLIKEIGLTTDLISLSNLYLNDMLNPPFSTLLINGETDLRNVTFVGKKKIQVGGEKSNQPTTLLAVIDLANLQSPAVINSKYSNSEDKLLVINRNDKVNEIYEMPQIQIDLRDIGITIFSSSTYIQFPGNKWGTPFNDMRQKITVFQGRLDVYTESTKTLGIYDGVPPYINLVGSGDYYINGVKQNKGFQTPTFTTKPHRSDGLSNGAIAGIAAGGIIFVLICTFISVFIYRKKKRLNNHGIIPDVDFSYKDYPLSESL